MERSRETMVNRAEAERCMDEAGLDALLAVSPENTFYFSGVFIRTQVSIRERLAFVIVPRKGEETFLVCNIEESLARTQGWIPDVRTYVEFAESPIDALARVLKDRGLDAARLGIEARYLSLGYAEEMAQRLLQARRVPADRFFNRIRNIKTAAQVALLTDAFQRTEQAVKEAWAASKAGETEKIVAERMVQEMVRHGADGQRHMTLAAGENTNHPHARPSDRPLRRGDIVMTDCGAMFGGYGSDIARVGAVGTPSAAQRDAYRILYEVHRDTIARIRPGVTFAALYEHCREGFARRGYKLPNPHVGHNLSILGGHEEPLLHPYAQEPVRAGMLLCIEPSLQMAPDARMHFEDLVLVKEDGPQILCWWDARELEVIAG